MANEKRVIIAGKVLEKYMEMHKKLSNIDLKLAAKYHPTSVIMDFSKDLNYMSIKLRQAIESKYVINVGYESDRNTTVKKLVKCPVCTNNVREDRLKKHLSKVHDVNSEKELFQKKVEKLKEYLVEKTNTEIIFSKPDWFILRDNKTLKKIKILCVFWRDSSKVMFFDGVVNAIKKILTKWQHPEYEKRKFDENSISLNKGTLTDNGWHAFSPDNERKLAIDLASSIYGVTHVIKALQITKKLPPCETYRKNINEDIQYLKENYNLYKSRQYDAVLHVRMK